MKRNKYNAQRTQYAGHNFDSKTEAERFKQLQELQREGVISSLKVHPTFVLQPGFTDRSGKRQRAIVYEADFSYINEATGRLMIEDTKGVETALFKLKRKMFLYHYPELELRIVRGNRGRKRVSKISRQNAH